MSLLSGRVLELVEEHWAYLRQVLELEGRAPQIIELVGFHYRTAMAHGHKHGWEDALSEGEEQTVEEVA